MEKRESTIRRVVGVSRTTEQSVLDSFKERFKKDAREDAIERPIDPELIEIIPVLNKQIKDFMEGFGLEAFEIPVNNIHLVDKSKLTPEQLEYLEKYYKTTIGWFSQDRQNIMMFIDYEKDNKLKFLLSLVHEMLHANSFQSLQRVDFDEGKRLKISETMTDDTVRQSSVATRRIGFNINSPKVKFYFHDIDEAIITELEMRFEDKYFSEIPAVQDEIAEKKKAIGQLAKGGTESPEELKRRLMAIQTRQQPDGQWESKVESYAYEKERKKLNELIDFIYKENKDNFQSREDVFNVFSKACLTGRLLPIARLIEKTYGVGSFRELGEETRDKRYEQ